MILFGIFGGFKLLDNDDVVIIERKFSLFNLVISIMLLVYYSTFWFFGYEELGVDTLIFCSIIFVFLIEYISANYNFWSSDFLYKIIKFLELLIASIIILRCNGFEVNVVLFAIIYYMIAFQAGFTFDITEGYSFVGLIVFSSMPMVTVVLFNLVLGKQSNFWAFVFIMFAVVLVTCIFELTYGNAYVLKNLYGKINKLNGVATSSIVENDSMKVMQNKLVQSNEQLSKQRFELEQANEKISKINEEMRLQSEIIRHFSNNLNINEVVDSVVNSVFTKLSCDLIHIGVYSEKHDDLYIYNTKYSEKSQISNKNLSLIEKVSFINELCEKDEFVLHNDYANISCAYLTETEIKSLIIYPGCINSDTKIIMLIGYAEPDVFDDKLSFYLNLVNQVTMSVSNALLYYEMEQMATMDPLTGIYNRRHFNAISNDYKELYMDRGKKITVVLFDIDKFKNINDSYGHIFGDEVIGYCGSVAKKYAKEYDGLPVRYGGEEFILVFPDRDIEEVHHICTLMHEEIKEKEFDYNEKIIKINTSIGIATYIGESRDFEELVNHADEAMYYSKEHGRGRITLYSEMEK